MHYAPLETANGEHKHMSYEEQSMLLELPQVEYVVHFLKLYHQTQGTVYCTLICF
jgi:hypothetical protein